MTAASTAPLVITPEVAEAIATGRAVVALESTIITHGMPYPDNLAMARAVEAIVRDAGAVPATIALVGGRSEEHTSELQSLMRISYAVFCLQKKTNTNTNIAL